MGIEGILWGDEKEVHEENFWDNEKLYVMIGVFS